MKEILLGFLNATLRISTPLLLGGLGEMIIEKSGVLNLGIEGMMLLSAFAGFQVTFATHSPWLGLLAAIGTAIVAGFLVGLLMVTGRLGQHISGLGITRAAIALSALLYHLYFGAPPSCPRAETFPLLDLGGVLRQYLLTYMAFALVPVLHLLLARTPLGLRIQTAGDRPEALDATGVNVNLTRYQALLVGSILIGVAGGFLTVAQLGYFNKDMVSGRGWICLALANFGNWRPLGVLAGALLFSGLEAAQIRIQLFGVGIHHEFFALTPYLLTVLALATMGRRQAPLALLEPFPREEEIV